MLKVLSIFGTRPEAVKMAPVVKKLAASSQVESIVCVTAQHRQMLDQVLHVFDIHPDVDLDLMEPDQSLAKLTSEIFIHLDRVLRDYNPDWLLVQGDTTTVMTAAILGYYHHIRVGHVEAGLRTGDKWQPFPEEINRRVTGVVADLHFAPTEHSRQNLLREGLEDWRIIVTGNPVVDALHMILQQELPHEVQQLVEEHDIGPDGKKLVLVTAHRRENFGEPLESICRSLRTLAGLYEDRTHFIYPVHLNPNVREPVYRLLQDVNNITLLEPLDYPSMVHLIQKASLVLTDSGGIQEEATALNTPTLVLRKVTERPEGVQAGVLKLVGTDSAIIIREARRLLDDPEAYRSMMTGENP
ncbi:MAG: UDP-N-acetylglucosamine 2-epimerase (non-hydrolyzing), partial [Anaerolineaceae bacterium]|nr:UDP-N-acetylglucosamine 2-epimerase (non-hydrolyzing) [Anaerolineaceae bacterium]